MDDSGGGAQLEAMLLHQNALNIVQSRLESGVFPECTDDHEPPLPVPPAVVKHALDIFSTIRSVISSSGADKSFLGHARAVVDTLIQQLGACATQKERMRCISLAFLLQCLCFLPNETLQLKEVSRALQDAFYSESPLYGSIIQCLELSLSIAKQAQNSNRGGSMIDDDLASPALVTNLLLEVVKFCHGTSGVHTGCRVPRKACVEVLLRCGAFDTAEIRRRSMAILEEFLTYISGSHDNDTLPFLSLTTQCLAEKLRETLCRGKTAEPSHNFNYQMSLLERLLSYLPPSQRVSLIVHEVFEHLNDLGRSGNHAVAVAVFRAMAVYFQREEFSTSMFPADESWDADRQIVVALIGHHASIFNSRRSAAQIRAIFSGLCCLIRSIDVDENDSKVESSGKSHQSSSKVIQASRRVAVMSLLRSMTQNKKGFLCAAAVEADPTIQAELLQGWSLFCQTAATGTPLLYYPVITPLWTTLLGPQFKPVWRSLFQCFHMMFDTVQETIVVLYELFGSESYTLALSSFVSALAEVDCDASDRDASVSETQQKMGTFHAALNAAYKQGFGSWYQCFGSLLFDTVFRPPVTSISIILRETEEPSDETLCLLSKTMSEELSLVQLKSREAAMYRTELRRCIASCFALFGSRIMLELESLSLAKLLTTPLRSETFAYTSNAWVLPLMANCVRRDSLRYYMDHVLTLTRDLAERCKKLHSGDLELIEARHYRRLIEQVWSLLPAFFREPTDGPEVFRSDVLAQALCNLMVSQLDVPIVRDHVCAALALLCKQLSSLTDEDNDDGKFLRLLWCDGDDVIDLTVLKAQANRFMGMLVVRFLQFHKTLSSTEQDRNQSSRVAQVFLEALRGLVLLCDTELVERNLQNFSAAWDNAVKNACTLLTNGDGPARFVLHAAECGALVDVVDALIPKLSQASREELFVNFLQLLHNCSVGLSQTKKTPHKERPTSKLNISTERHDNAYRTLQCLLRRAYKGLKHIVEYIAAGSVELLPDRALEIWKTLLEARDMSRSTAMKARTAFLRPFIVLLAKAKRNWDAEAQQTVANELLAGIVPEMLLGLSESNKSIRTEARDLLKAVAEHLCLGEATVMKSSTLTALGCLVSAYGDKMSPDRLREMFPLALLLLEDSDKQLFVAALAFIRTFQRYVTNEELPQLVKEYLPPMLNSPHAMPYRVAIRNLLDKVVKRVGVDALKPVFPEQHLALLNYIDKALKRRQARARMLREVEDTDELPRSSARAQRKEFHRDDSSDSGDDDFVSSSLPSIEIATKNDVPNIKSLLDAFEAESDTENDAARRTKRGTSAIKPGTTTCLVEGNQTDLLATGPNSMVLVTSHGKKRRVSETDATFTRSDDTSFSNEERQRPRSRSVSDFGNVQHPAGANPFAPNRSNARSLTTSDNCSKTLGSLKEKREALKALKNSTKKKGGHAVQKPAESFRSSKAKGDVNKSSRVLPYSYIKLNPSMVKEKNRSDAIKTFRENTRRTKERSVNATATV